MIRGHGEKHFQTRIHAQIQYLGGMASDLLNHIQIAAIVNIHASIETRTKQSLVCAGPHHFRETVVGRIQLISNRLTIQVPHEKSSLESATRDHGHGLAERQALNGVLVGRVVLVLLSGHVFVLLGVLTIQVAYGLARVGVYQINSHVHARRGDQISVRTQVHAHDGFFVSIRYVKHGLSRFKVPNSYGSVVIATGRPLAVFEYLKAGQIRVIARIHDFDLVGGQFEHYELTIGGATKQYIAIRMPVERFQIAAYFIGPVHAFVLDEIYANVAGHVTGGQILSVRAEAHTSHRVAEFLALHDYFAFVRCVRCVRPQIEEIVFASCGE